MKVATFNRSLMIMSVIAGISMNAVALDSDMVQEIQSPSTHEFNKLDINNNGLIPWSEMEKDGSIEQNTFINADKNGDKALDEDEFATMKAELGKTKVNQVISDSAITAKIKAKLLAEESLKSLKISVETYKGDVILSGFVDSEKTKAKAEQLASSISGVKSVKNGLLIKN